MTYAYTCLTHTCKLSKFQAAEKFKAPQPAPVIPEAKAAAIEQEEESEEEEVCEGTLVSLTIKSISLASFVCCPISCYSGEYFKFRHTCINVEMNIFHKETIL